jgi:hypothetical protein
LNQDFSVYFNLKYFMRDFNIISLQLVSLTQKKESFINDWKQKSRDDLGPQPIRAAF